jgi:hypothetical protein
LAVCREVQTLVEAIGRAEVRTTRSQVAFRWRRGFAYLWFPPFWVAGRAADVVVVLSIALDRPLESPRFKQIAHPAPKTWMHHLEVRSLEDLDDEVREWLQEAYVAAA